MIKPIGIMNSNVVKTTKKVNPLIDKAAARERIINLIKEFEEAFKTQQDNKALAKHIQDLKESLKMYE